MTSQVKKQAIIFVIVLGAVVGLSLLAQSGTKVDAQTDIEGVWEQPVNLSHSGVATDPVWVVDSNGNLHILWWDSFDGFVYTHGDGTTWTSPMLVELPFGTRRFFPDLREEETTPRFTPHMVAGQDGRIHAFWQDDENVLFASSVPADEISEFDAWIEPQILAESALVYDVIVSQDGRLHVAYLQTSHTESSPAGIYYRQLYADDFGWTGPTIISEDIYFRLLEPDDVHLVIAADENGRAYIAWDDPRLGRLFLAQSVNRGISWREPQEIDIPDVDDLQVVEQGETNEYRCPNLVDVVSLSSGSMHLVWDVSGDNVCALFHQISDDGGISWDDPFMLPGDLCYPVVELVQDGEDLLLIHGMGHEESTLLAWDGIIWSEPLVLPTGFEDPETGRTVQLECLKVASYDAKTLLVAGCDSAGGGDFWLLSLSDDVVPNELFATPTPISTSVWSTPVSISIGQPEAPVEARHLVMVGDPDVEGRFHLVWSQPAETDLEGPGRELVYARWESLESEGQPRPVTLLSLSNEKADQPALAANESGILHLVWSGGLGGDILYSRVVAESAFNPASWGEPQLLQMPRQAGSSPAIAIDPDDVIHVVFAVPLNEGRGIYYTCSADGGESWFGPAIVADGVEAGWQVVDHPALAIGGDGTIHVAWSVLPFSGSPPPGAIYYAHLSHCGGSWSDPYKSTEGAVDWPRLVVAGMLQVQLLWSETAEHELRYRWSTDGGQNWMRWSPIPGFDGLGESALLVKDRANRIHLVGLGASGLNVAVPEVISRADSMFLLHRMWDGEQWIGVDGDTATFIEGVSKDLTSFAVAAGDRLGLAIAQSMLERQDKDSDEIAGQITLLSMPLELPAVPIMPEPSLTPTRISTTQPLPTETPLPSPTPDLSGSVSDRMKVGPFSMKSQFAGLVFGAIPAALLVLLAFVVGVVVIRRQK